MEDCAGLRDWELVVASDLSETLKAADALNDDSEDGAIKADYFALDSSGLRDRSQSEEESNGRSEDSDNPNWIDPDSNTRFLETSRGQLGFIGTKIPVRNFCGFWSDDSSDGQKSLPGGEKGESLNLGDSFMEVASEGSESRCENLGGETENYGTQEMVDVGGCGRDYAREGGKRDNAWRKMPLVLLKFCIFRVRPVWSIPIAVAMVGIVMLGRKLYRLKHKSWSIPLRISINDKKASQFAARTAPFNEAISVVRRMQIVRPSPAVGATRWAALPLG